MYLFKSIAALQSHLQGKRNAGKSIGFVPTMGALHSGHSSLITHSVDEGQYTVLSIYVNPTQFNDPHDLDKYPRPVAEDLALANKLNVNVVFLPSDNEMYPEEGFEIPNIELGHLGKSLEAAFRPGHFEGVVKIMYRLLSIVQPDFLYMGLKDLQQVAVVRHLILSVGFSCKLIGLPIIREPHGLARSSRNERLSEADRQNASLIYEVLKFAFDKFHEMSLEDLRQEALERLNQHSFRPEYFEFVETGNLHILTSKQAYTGSISAVTAVWCGEIRLIDNMEMP